VADSQLETITQLTVPVYAPRPEPTPIPTAAWNDEPLYCLEVNDQWISHILGVMVALDQPDTWIGTPEEIDAARQQVNEIMAAFMAACEDDMNCCEEPLTRIAADGSIEISTDGGETWTPATTDDPRNKVPQLAPLTGDDGDDKRCRAANNIVRQLKDLQASWSDDLDAGLTLLQLGLAFAGGIAALFLTAGTAAVYVVPALLEMAAALVGTGSEAYDDLFTTEVWDFALCQFYCHCEPDGTFTQASFNDMLANFDTEFTGNLALAFSSAMTGWQLVGLNRAARLVSTDNLDCSACTDCDDCVDPCLVEWTFYGVTDVVKISDCHYTMTVSGVGHFAFSSGDQALGCYYTAGSFLGSQSTWPVGSPTATPVNPKTTAIWNYDTGDYSTGTMLDIVFSASPIP